MRKKPLSGQVLVVTGASSGLGRAIVHAAGARGSKVVVTARNAEALDDCVREIERLGGEARAVAADHAVQDEVAQVVVASALVAAGVTAAAPRVRRFVGTR